MDVYDKVQSFVNKKSSMNLPIDYEKLVYYDKRKKENYYAANPDNHKIEQLERNNIYKL